MLSDGIVLSIAINRQCRKSAKIADCLARHSGTALRMARLGSLFSLSEEFVDNASLASIPSAPQKHEVAQLASSGQEEPSITASQQRSETDQGMTCLTCGIGIVPCDHVCSASERLYLSQKWLLTLLQFSLHCCLRSHRPILHGRRH